MRLDQRSRQKVPPNGRGSRPGRTRLGRRRPAPMSVVPPGLGPDRAAPSSRSPANGGRELPRRLPRRGRPDARHRPRCRRPACRRRAGAPARSASPRTPQHRPRAPGTTRPVGRRGHPVRGGTVARAAGVRRPRCRRPACRRRAGAPARSASPGTPQHRLRAPGTTSPPVGGRRRRAGLAAPDCQPQAHRRQSTRAKIGFAVVVPVVATPMRAARARPLRAVRLYQEGRRMPARPGHPH